MSARRAGPDALDATDRPRRPVPVLEVGALVVAIAGAATTWSQTFGWRAIALPVALATLLPAAVALLLARRPAALALVASIVLFPIATVGVLVAAGSSNVASDLVDGLQRGWGDILSTAVPVTGAPGLLVVPVALTWLATLVGAEVIVRTRRVLAPLAAPVGLLVLARLYSPSGASTASLGAAALIAGGVAVVAARHARLGSAASAVVDESATGSIGARADLREDDTDARRLARRRTIIALPLAFVAVAVGVLAGPRIIPASSRPAASLRDARTPEVRSPREQDPLDELNGTLADAPTTRLFTVTMRPGPLGTGRAAAPDAAVAPGTRWLLLTLDTFDGTSWTSSARFARAGTTLPAGPALATGTTEVHQTITVDRLPGTWLPALDRPLEARSLDGQTRLTVDATSGTLATDGDDLAPGARYEVTSLVPTPSGADLAGARLPSGAAFAPFVRLPASIPKEITDVTRQAMASAHTPFEQVAALERYLQTNGFTYDAAARTGHSLGDLARFLAEPKDGRRDARTGTAEQFATAFTVMARTRGLPTRLAVGFRPGADATWRADGENVSLDLVRGNTDIWPEVYFDGLGWVAFDPVPTNGGTSTRPEVEPEEVAATKSRAADAATDPQAPPAPPASNPIIATDPVDAGAGRPWLVVASVAGGLVVLALVLLLGSRFARRASRRRRRARRHGAADPASRILGAWHEAIDHLDRVGGFEISPPDRPAAAAHLASATVSEVGDAVARRHGDAVAEPVRSLGRIVNASTFEPEPPSPTEADRAWSLESDIRRTITAKTPVVEPPAPAPPTAPPVPIPAAPAPAP